jgi:hypothetical protein
VGAHGEDLDDERGQHVAELGEVSDNGRTQRWWHRRASRRKRTIGKRRRVEAEAKGDDEMVADPPVAGSHVTASGWAACCLRAG